MDDFEKFYERWTNTWDRSVVEKREKTNFLYAKQYISNDFFFFFPAETIFLAKICYHMSHTSNNSGFQWFLFVVLSFNNNLIVIRFTFSTGGGALK